MSNQTPITEVLPEKKKRKLTAKQRGWVRDYLATNNASEATRRNYDVAPGTVTSLASENLAKPSIQEAIREAIPPDFLTQKHQELFAAKKLDYFVFPKVMEDDEIVAHCASVGVTVITVRLSDKGKMAFYTMPDAQAIKNALEMSYKIAGAFVPETGLGENSGNTYNFLFSSDTQASIKEFEDRLKAKLLGHAGEVQTNQERLESVEKGSGGDQKADGENR